MVPLVPTAVTDERAVFRFQSRAVLLTYQGIDAVEAEALKVWTCFLLFVQGNKRAWGLFTGRQQWKQTKTVATIYT